MGGNSSGTFSQTNIQEIITSRRVVEEALLKRGIIDGEEDLLINHHIAFNDLRKNGRAQTLRIYTLLLEKILPYSMIVF